MIKGNQHHLTSNIVFEGHDEIRYYLSYITYLLIESIFVLYAIRLIFM